MLCTNAHRQTEISLIFGATVKVVVVVTVMQISVCFDHCGHVFHVWPRQVRSFVRFLGCAPNAVLFVFVHAKCSFAGEDKNFLCSFSLSLRKR